MLTRKHPPTTITILAAALLLAACGGGDSTPEVTEEQIQQLRSRSEAFQGKSLQRMQADEEALALGQALANAHCASCHGLDGSSPQRGIPNLASASFDYGDSAEAIQATITQGRHSLMPPLGAQMGEVEIGALVAHVQGLGSGEGPTTFARTASELYQEHCVSCHGPQGKGKPEIGAPDLTDEHWQYGDSMMNVRLNITRGLDTRHPALGGELSQTEIDLLTAYVLEIRK